MDRGSRLTVGGVITAIVLVVLGAASATPWVVTLQFPDFGPGEPATLDIPPMTLAPQEPREPNLAAAETLQTVLLILLTVIITAIVGFLLFWLVRRLRAAWRPDDEAVEADQLGSGDLLDDMVVDIASLATAVARAEAHLDGIAEPGDAVTAAWVALEDEAALQGTARDPAQTTTEFTTALLQRTPAPAGAVATLRSLYHRARFTTHPITVQDVRRARESLGRIAESLDAAAPADGHQVEAP